MGVHFFAGRLRVGTAGRARRAPARMHGAVESKFTDFVPIMRVSLSCTSCGARLGVPKQARFLGAAAAAVAMTVLNFIVVLLLPSRPDDAIVFSALGTTFAIGVALGTQVTRDQTTNLVHRGR